MKKYIFLLLIIATLFSSCQDECERDNIGFLNVDFDCINCYNGTEVYVDFELDGAVLFSTTATNRLNSYYHPFVASGEHDYRIISGRKVIKEGKLRISNCRRTDMDARFRL